MRSEFGSRDSMGIDKNTRGGNVVVKIDFQKAYDRP